MNKLIGLINRILSTKVGKFLFEVVNIIALLFLTIYMFGHVKILLGAISLFCFASNVLILIDKYKKKKE
nr:MAG TPA: hypothetical protein [Caudoviricetes sp.]